MVLLLMVSIHRPHCHESRMVQLRDQRIFREPKGPFLIRTRGCGGNIPHKYGITIRGVKEGR